MEVPFTRTAAERPDIKQLRAIEGTLIDVAAGFKLNLKRAPESTYLHLAKSPLNVAATAAKHLSELTEVFLTCASENVNPWDDTEFFRISMRRMGLSFSGDFLSHVTEGDLIEGYDMSRLQIFRNLPFMEMSGYSLLEIMSYEWPDLFDRSTAITQRLLGYCEETLWTANRTIPLEIPNHYMRERTSNERLMWEVQFRHLSPLFAGPGRPFGILGTCRVKAVNIGHPIEKTTFV